MKGYICENELIDEILRVCHQEKEQIKHTIYSQNKTDGTGVVVF